MNRYFSIRFQCVLLSQKIQGSGYCAQEFIKNDPRLCRQFIRFEKENPDIFLKEALHLGNYRYYVCPDGLIPVDKLPEGWGLYYYKNGKFYLKRKSAKFRSNYRKELDLVIHSFRRYANGDNTGIMVKAYSDGVIEDKEAQNGSDA